MACHHADSVATVSTWIALFRGINVMGSNSLPMKDLAALLQREGFADVRTYIQSGNAVFRSAARSGRFAGYAGPANRKAAEAISKYILVDMYAKAVQGMPAEDAVKSAHGELVKIYA